MKGQVIGYLRPPWGAADARTWSAILTLVLGVTLVGCRVRSIAEVYTTGLNQPRGMAFDRTGELLVAEAGALGPADTGDVRPPTNYSGRVTRIGTDRRVSVVVDGLPFTHYVAAGDMGVTDIVVLGDVMYVLTGEGYDDAMSRAVLRVREGRVERVASLLSFALATTPIEYQMSSGGVAVNPFAMVAAPDGGAMYVSDGASGRIVRVTLNGDIRVFAELPNMPPLTGLAFGPDGRLFVGMFSALPHTPGTGAIWAAEPSGRLSPVVEGLTMPIDVGFDAAGRMYVLEFGTGRRAGQPYAGSSGRLLRIERDGARRVILDGLDRPTAMAFSAKGDLYIGVSGAFSGAGRGAIVRAPCQALGAPDACRRETRR